MSVSCEVVRVSVKLPIYARSEANQRDHRMVRARRAKEQRGVVGMMLRASSRLLAIVRHPNARATIKLTRVHRRRARPLDDDNLRGSLKAVRDGVADVLGLDDADPRLRWEYGQEPGADYAVRIEIEIGGGK